MNNKEKKTEYEAGKRWDLNSLTPYEPVQELTGRRNNGTKTKQKMSKNKLFSSPKISECRPIAVYIKFKKV